MSEPPPPSGPPAGWYTDPVTGAGYRWWDGSTWTEAVSGAEGGLVGVGPGRSPASTVPGPAGDVRPELIGRVDRLLSETLRSTSARTGHLLPLVVLFVLSIGLVSSVALWFGLRDTVISFDEAAASAPEIDYGGSAVALWIYLATVPLSLLAGSVVQAATARQVWFAQAGRAEIWSASLAGVRRRWRPLIGATLIKWIGYVIIAGGFLAATALVPAFIIAFPFVAIVLVLAWIRLSFIGQAAVLAPDGVSPLSTSYRVSGRQPAKLFVRLVVLLLAGAAVMLVISLIGSLFSAIAGAEATTPIDPDALTYDLNAALGDNLALFALSAVFGSLALGAAMAIIAAGTTLLYRNLEGPVSAELASLGPIDATDTIDSTGPIDAADATAPAPDRSWDE